MNLVDGLDGGFLHAGEFCLFVRYYTNAERAVFFFFSPFAASFGFGFGVFVRRWEFSFAVTFLKFYKICLERIPLQKVCSVPLFYHASHTPATVEKLGGCRQTGAPVLLYVVHLILCFAVRPLYPLLRLIYIFLNIKSSQL